MSFLQGISEGAGAVNTIGQGADQALARDINRQYARADAARQRQEWDIQIQAKKIANDVNSTQLEVFKQEQDRKNRNEIYAAIAHNINTYGAGPGMNKILGDQNLVNRIQTIYPNSEFGFVRPVDVSTLNPEFVKDKAKEVAQTISFQKSGGLVAKNIEGPDGVQTSYDLPEVTQEDIQQAMKNMVFLSDSRTGEIYAVAGDQLAQMLFPDIIAQHEYDKQQEQHRRELEKEAFDKLIKEGELNLGNRKQALAEQQYNTNLNLYKQALKDPSIDQGSFTGVASFNKPDNAAGGTQAITTKDVNSLVDSIANGNFENIKIRTASDFGNAVTALSDAIRAQNGGKLDTEGQKQLAGYLGRIAMAYLSNPDVPEELKKEVITWYNAYTDAKLTNSDHSILASGATVDTFLNSLQLGKSHVGAFDRHWQKFMAFLGDLLPENYAQHLKELEEANLRGKGIITSMLVSTYGSQLTKHELEQSGLQTSDWNSYIQYASKLSQALSQTESKLKAAANSPNALVRANAEKTLGFIENYRKNAEKVASIDKALNTASWWGLGKPRIKELHFPNGVNVDTIKDQLKRGQSVLYKEPKSGQYIFIPAGQRLDQNLEGHPLNSFEVKKIQEAL